VPRRHALAVLFARRRGSRAADPLLQPGASCHARQNTPSTGRIAANSTPSRACAQRVSALSGGRKGGGRAAGCSTRSTHAARRERQQSRALSAGAQRPGCRCPDSSGRGPLSILCLWPVAALSASEQACSDAAHLPREVRFAPTLCLCLEGGGCCCCARRGLVFAMPWEQNQCLPSVCIRAGRCALMPTLCFCVEGGGRCCCASCTYFYVSSPKQTVLLPGGVVLRAVQTRGCSPATLAPSSDTRVCGPKPPNSRPSHCTRRARARWHRLHTGPNSHVAGLPDRAEPPAGPRAAPQGSGCARVGRRAALPYLAVQRRANRNCLQPVAALSASEQGGAL